MAEKRIASFIQTPLKSSYSIRIRINHSIVQTMTLKQEDIRYMKETVRKAVDNSTKHIGPEKK